MIRKRSVLITALLVMSIAVTAGCGRTGDRKPAEQNHPAEKDGDRKEGYAAVPLTSGVVRLEDGLSAVRYEGGYGFDAFLSQGGASSDEEVAAYLSEHILSGTNTVSLEGMPFGCSTLSVRDAGGSYLFGRNFDWNSCNAMIVSSVPENGYASVSTVNTDFIQVNGIRLSGLPDEVQAAICLYAPLDGVNGSGLAVSVNMIEDTDTVSQNTEKPDITTTTAVRLLLDKAGDVDEAVKLLEQYDMHASMEYMMHLALADTSGRSVVIEYVDNEMVVTETPVVTNFYHAAGDKNGIGTEQSHERYDILMKMLADGNTMTMEEVRDALDRVSKDNFGGAESTEWSIVWNLSTGEARYYHRENYENCHTIKIG